MKVSKKITEKLVVLVMIFSLIGPIFLSTTVSAAEKTNTSEDIVSEEQNKLGESEDSIILKEGSVEATVESNSTVESDESVVSESEETSIDVEESVIENEEADSTTETEDNQITKDNNDAEEIEQVEEYYSAEETREQAIEMMEAEQNTVSTYSSKLRSVSKTNAFINATSSYAVSVANKYDLYPSVMIAQAALESAWGTSILAYNPNFNYFGIKGNYNGNSFSKYTKEYNEKDGWKVIKADFKKYPSINETFIDYANKLTKGPEWDSKNGSWDKNYYSGTWKKNAKTYQDATKALKGKYATDPDYNTKLNSIIKTYDLTRFDKATSSGSNEDKLESELKEINYDEVVSTTDVKDYSMYINGSSDGIYTAPKGTKDSKVTSTTIEYQGKKVVVTEEKKTKDGLTWAHIKLDGKYLGWIDLKGLTSYDVILSEKDIKYSAKISRKTDGINTKPYGVEGYKLISLSSAYYGQTMSITKEMVTNRATWSYIDGLGWIDKKGLDIEKITSTKDTSYFKTISREADGINTKPYGVEGFELGEISSKYFGKRVKVTKEATTRRATWAYITLDGKELGWIDMRGLSDSDYILSGKDIKYSAKISRKTDGINTKPYGVAGYKLISLSSAYYGQTMSITKEMVTNRATWSYIDGFGWIDKKGLDIEKITSTKDTSYFKTISRESDGINTKPYGVEGFELKELSSKYLGKKVKVTKEATTRRATWAYITLDGKELGWIDMRGLSDATLSEKNINYSAKISRKTDGINTKPYGLAGYKLVSLSSAYYGKTVSVTKEMVTNRATWSYIDGLGWIDKKGLDIEKITSTKDTSYFKTISREADGINTKPYGVEGFELKELSSKYLGKKVKVTKEATTRRATWAYITLDGKELGWIDMRGLSDVILSEKNINYSAKIIRKTDGINTKPYGLAGYKLVSLSSAYYGKTMSVTKEMVTTRATWSYIDGLGWIDKKGLDIEKITSTKDTSYYKRISRKTDGINTKPYGVEGFELKELSSKYLGKKVKVTKEATTRRATWAYITLDGKELGWIDTKGLTDSDVILSEKNINYSAEISRKTDGINTKPYGLAGYKLISLSSAYYGKTMSVTKEMVTTRATWSYIDGLGWIDKKGLDIEKITSTKDTSYYKRISRKTDGINTKPYGVEGFELKELSSKYLGKKVKVTKEATTRRATWAYITLDGKELGWIDARGLTDSDVILSEKNINYTAKINRKTDGINTKPYGVEGFKLVSMSAAYYGKNVTVTKEMVTTRATWAYISSEGKGLGWIDKKGLTRVDLFKKVVVIDPGHGGKDPGAQAGGVKEKDLNLIVAKKVKQKLENAGYEVVMTRSTDKFLALSEIASIANKANPDIFVSIHTNSFNGSANGIETYSYTPGETKPINIAKSHNPKRLLNSSLLSQSIQSSLIKNTGAYNRQAKKANFVVVRDTWMPAVLVEIGFVDNTAERNKLVTNTYQDKLSAGIVEGIQSYFKSVK